MEKKRKNKKESIELDEAEIVKAFYNAETVAEKLAIFSMVQSDEQKIEMLSSIPEEEKYRFIGKLKVPENIAHILSSLTDTKSREKTFQFVIKSFKGNAKGLLEILSSIDFNIALPKNMLEFKINSLNGFDLDLLLALQRNVSNYTKMKFRINERVNNRYDDVSYSFSEFSAIIAKIEELTGDITEDMSEADRFYAIYSRLTTGIVYDYGNILSQDKMLEKKEGYMLRSKELERFNQIRKKAAGLFGGLVEGKAICAGYAIILHEAIQRVGMKSNIIIRI